MVQQDIKPFRPHYHLKLIHIIGLSVCTSIFLLHVQFRTTYFLEQFIIRAFITKTHKVTSKDIYFLNFYHPLLAEYLTSTCHVTNAWLVCWLRYL